MMAQDGQDRLGFNHSYGDEQNGIPIFGELRDPNLPILLPQGEPQRKRYQLDSPVQNPAFDV